jgi:DNA polymerase-3 subunit epsilon
MRQIVLDTETTGINPKLGNRVIEIGCVELLDRKLTGNNFHCYLNPDRESEEGALAVHGLTTEFLSDKPRFHEIVDALREYIQGAEVIIHNAPFDWVS